MGGGKITHTSGKGSAKFVKPIRAKARWSPEENQKIERAVFDGLSLTEVMGLFAHRTYASVKDKYYRTLGWDKYSESWKNWDDEEDCDLPPALADARRQKDAREGSAKLYEALVKAGLYVPPELKKSA